MARTSAPSFYGLKRTESDQAKRRDGKEHAAIGLLLYGMERAGQADRVRRIAVVGGETEKRADDEKHRGARQYAVRPERGHPDRRHLVRIDALRIRLADDRNDQTDRGDDEAGGDQTDRDAAQRLCHQPRRPVSRRSVGFYSPDFKSNVCCRYGEPEVKYPVADEQRAGDPAGQAVATTVGVKHTLHKSPAGKASQSDGDDPQQRAPEVTLEQRLQRAAHSLRPRFGADGGEQRERADDQKHDPAGDITGPRHPDPPARRRVLAQRPG